MFADIFRSPRQSRFYSLLGEQAALLVKAADSLVNYVRDGEKSHAEAVAAAEQQDDEVVGKLLSLLRDTYLTPFDRQDIYNLSEAIDDMIDYLHNAAREIEEFDLHGTPAMLEMATILARAAEAVQRAVQAIAAKSEAAYDHAQQASAAENEVEELYRRTLAELFKNEDVREALRLREVYRHLSNSADRAATIARVICKIVVKAS